MAFRKEPFEPAEKQLFAQLPFEDKYMGFGAVGHMRGEVDYFGLRHMRITEAKHLATPAFKKEYVALMLALRRGSFRDGEKLRKVWKASQSLDGSATGFKVRGDSYSYFFRCEPSRTIDGYDVCMYAYDNALLLPELAGQHKLPEKCYTLLEGTITLLSPGEQPLCVPSDDPPELKREVVDELNAELGVTKAQKTAMRMGFRHGYDQPAAQPWQYDAQGQPRDFTKNNKENGARA